MNSIADQPIHARPEFMWRPFCVCVPEVGAAPTSPHPPCATNEAALRSLTSATRKVLMGRPLARRRLLFAVTGSFIAATALAIRGRETQTLLRETPLRVGAFRETEMKGTMHNESSMPKRTTLSNSLFPDASSAAQSAPPGRKIHRSRLFVIAALSLTVAHAHAANIVWVSDAPAAGFSGPGGPNLTDYGFIRLLQDAGHNVIRFNSADAQATLLTAAEIDALNTNDLIIVGRATGSGAFQSSPTALQQGAQWNTNIIKPLIEMSPYHTRTNGLRLGWFAGNEGVDDGAPARPAPGSASNPAVDYLFQDVVMSGATTAQPYDDPLDRNTSIHTALPVAGGVVLATANFPRLSDGVATNGFIVTGFPAGTTVRMGFDVLPAYRMMFAGGSRESGTAPNGVNTYAGRENLSPVGDRLFLRSVELALNSGVAPATNTGPADIVAPPASLTVTQGQAALFSVMVTGEAPRLVEWQRDDGAGSFTNIPGTASTPVRSAYGLATTALSDNGAQFRVVVSNALNVATSEVAILTVEADTAPPVVLSAGSFSGNAITIWFDEAVDPGLAGDAGNYQIDGGAILVSTVEISTDGKSVTLNLQSSIGTTATLDLLGRGDTNGNTSFDVVTLTVFNLGLTGVDIGALNPPGTNLVCASNTFQVIAGGLDLGPTNDILRLVSKPVTGDFDARVRVTDLRGTFDSLETTAKAILTAREQIAVSSGLADVWVTPLPPADNTISARVRPGANVGIANVGAAVTPSGLPNAWLRIMRIGNQFSTYRSTNGSNWVAFGTNTLALGPTLNVGVGAVSHRNGRTITATFSDFKIAAPVLPVRLKDQSFESGTFVAYFDSQTGVSYTVEYKDDLNSATWQTLTMIAGDGTTKSFSDPGPVPAGGSRFYRVTAQ